MSKPLRQTAYTKFRQSLFERTLKPGQFVSQRELSELLDVPIGAIREALKRLEADGLIKLIAQRGVQIADVNVTFINEAFEFRILIEAEAARRMTANPDRERLTALRARTEQVRAACDGLLSEELAERGMTVDLELHSLLMSVFTNGLIQESYRLLEDKIRMIRLNGTFTAARLQSAMTEHLAIIDAVLSGDADAAVETLVRHLKTSWRRSLGQPEDLV